MSAIAQLAIAAILPGSAFLLTLACPDDRSRGASKFHFDRCPLHFGKWTATASIDWNVGRIFKKLEELKLRENTVVVFFSDNGPNSFRWNGGMKRRKGSIDEGGLRSQFFIRWPHRIPAGSSVGNISGAIDLLPTLTDLANIKLKTKKPIDGRSLKQLLLRQSTGWPSRRSFSIRRNQVSIRTERFRLDAKGQLFDIAKDPWQHKNVAAQHPDLVLDLRRQAKEHTKEMEKSHYFVKDFKPLSLGTIELEKGQEILRLDAREIQGKRCIDVHSIDLILK